MKSFKLIILILVVFLNTGNVLSENNLFSVNNILIEKNDNLSSKQLANKAIKDAYFQLIKRILLKKDISIVSNLSEAKIRALVTYYNISKNKEEETNLINFNITFDKDKMHDLFFKNGISYSDIGDKEFYILPVLLTENEIFIFSNNYFYENWNNVGNDTLLEFILPLENIEIIQNINQSKNNLLDLELNLLFGEYSDKNLAVVLIQNNKPNEKKIYLKTRIQNKVIAKNLNLARNNLSMNKFNEKIIIDAKDELINLVKSQNLIDVRTPSFLNVKLNLNKQSNLVLLKSRIKNIDLVENILVQNFSKNYVNVKIKYFGSLEKILNQLKNEDINLEFNNDQWVIKTL